MNVLVTGASGLVGNFIISKLIEIREVTLFAQSRNSSDFINSSLNINFLEIDLTSEKANEEILTILPHVIIHCAAQIPTDLFGDEYCSDLNRKIDKNIYLIAQRCNSKVIFLSSTAIYEKSIMPWSESQPVSPISSYAKQKLSSEITFSQLQIPCVSLRITSPYGGLQNAKRNVLYKFMHTAMLNEPLRVYGSGKRNQNFIFAGDIADVIKIILIKYLEGFDISGIFNIACDSTISMRDLAKLIVRIVGGGEVVSIDGFNEEDQIMPKVDISKANDLLNWNPNTKIEDGIHHLITMLKS